MSTSFSFRFASSLSPLWTPTTVPSLNFLFFRCESPMGRSPCCTKVGLRRGPWSSKEDTLLKNFIQLHGEGQWRSLPKKAGLQRCGKSCRLRWMNYLRPGIKRGNIGEDEEDLIVRLHGLLGNRWSLIAGRLPGRTDNEIKNYWNTYLAKKLNTAEIHPPKSEKPKELEAPMKKSKQKKTKAAANLAPVDKENQVEKIKVYAPKAGRVSSTFRSIYSYEIMSSRTASSEAMAAAAAADSNPPMTWPNLSDLDDFPLDDGFLNWDHIPPPDPFPDDLNMLEIVYDEFRHLV